MSQSLSQQSTQAIIGIVFGIVMFILTMITLWQGYRQRCRSAGAILTTGPPYAITSDVNVTTLEHGNYHRPTRGHRVILCRPLDAWVLHKLTADSFNDLLPHIKQWSKTILNDRIQLKHTFPPTSIVTRVFECYEPNPERILHHRPHLRHHAKQ